MSILYDGQTSHKSLSFADRIKKKTGIATLHSSHVKRPLDVDVLGRDGYSQKNRFAIYHNTGPVYRNTYHKINLKVRMVPLCFQLK